MILVIHEDIMKLNIYKHSGKIKKGLVVIAIGIILSTIIYTQNLVKQLRENSTQLVQFYAETYARALTDYQSSDFSFIFQEIIQKISFPIILSKQKHSQPINWRKIEVDKNAQTATDTSKVRAIMKDMDKANDPIPLEYEDKILGYIHYGDTKLIKRLALLPYIEIVMVSLFILLGYLGFHYIRKSEKQSIWVGMAKETAHQLGTPLSSLMGWQEVLKEELDKEEYIEEISKDINRLEKITNRFSKIGSKPTLNEQKIHPILKDALDYYKKRLPQLDQSVALSLDVNKELTAPISPDLFSWAIENMVKNSIDAAQEEEGYVKISAHQANGNINIDIIDNGKGIPKKNWKNIFRPGFSSKRRGWGLGLSLTQRIISEYHNGKIFVKSSEPYKKTVLRIVL